MSNKWLWHWWHKCGPGSHRHVVQFSSALFSYSRARRRAPFATISLSPSHFDATRVPFFTNHPSPQCADATCIDGPQPQRARWFLPSLSIQFVKHNRKSLWPNYIIKRTNSGSNDIYEYGCGCGMFCRWNWMCAAHWKEQRNSVRIHAVTTSTDTIKWM